MNATTEQTERAKIRQALRMRAEHQRVGAILAEQHHERQAERDAVAAMRADERITRLDASARRAVKEQHAARRRDALAKALDYPMTPEQLRDACQHATLNAHVQGTQVRIRKITKTVDENGNPTGEYADVSQALMLDVMRRHGPTPPRVKVQAGWLRQRAAGIALDALRQHDRTTGQRAAAEQLANWRQADNREAMTTAAASGDLVYALASGRPTWDQVGEEVTAERLASDLREQGLLTYLQADAVRVSLTHVRQRDADVIPGKVRVAFHAATAILRKRFHTADAVRCAVRPELYSARLLADAAIGAERKRATVASRGLPGRKDSASTAPLSRFT